MNTNQKPDQFDVVIVGGSYAGLSAALPLARARRRVAILDTGTRRNQAAHESHGFLTRDGESPAEIARLGKEQLLSYSTVTWIDAAATDVSGARGDFTVTTDAGRSLNTSLVILAMGVSDTLPAIPGLAERWGNAVFACPYCHGYELQQGPVAVIATGPMSYHQAWMLPEWGEVTFFTNEAITLDDEQKEALDKFKVVIEPAPISAVEGEATVRLNDSRELSFNGIAVATTWSINSEIPARLGLEIVESPMGPMLKVDNMQMTSVEGVFACGDISNGPPSLTGAVGSGYMAGIAAHRDLLMAR